MPSDWPDYELIDYGEGRKLERFGDLVCDRPSPTAERAKKTNPQVWRQADIRYSGAKVGEGTWRPPEGLRSSKRAIECPIMDEASLRLQIDLTPAGQVGLFPEQFTNWRWIARRIRRANHPVRVLNLFAYTGGASLAAAISGAEVTHVDASKPSVALARQNAALNNLADAPIRWIVEDALKYCRREAKRGNRYDAVIFDPPTYGHGPKGEAWSIGRDLVPLLEVCGELVERSPIFMLATCHSPGIGVAEIAAYLADGVFGSCRQPPSGGKLWLTTTDGRKLESGVYARWPQ